MHGISQTATSSRSQGWGNYWSYYLLTKRAQIHRLKPQKSLYWSEVWKVFSGGPSCYCRLLQPIFHSHTDTYTLWCLLKPVCVCVLQKAFLLCSVCGWIWSKRRRTVHLSRSNTLGYFTTLQSIKQDRLGITICPPPHWTCYIERADTLTPQLTHNRWRWALSVQGQQWSDIVFLKNTFLEWLLWPIMPDVMNQKPSHFTLHLPITYSLKLT